MQAARFAMSLNVYGISWWCLTNLSNLNAISFNWGVNNLPPVIILMSGDEFGINGLTSTSSANRSKKVSSKHLERQVIDSNSCRDLVHG